MNYNFISVKSGLRCIISFNLLVPELQNFCLSLFAMVAGMGRVAR